MTLYGAMSEIPGDRAGWIHRDEVARLIGERSPRFDDLLAGAGPTPRQRQTLSSLLAGRDGVDFPASSDRAAGRALTTAMVSARCTDLMLVRSVSASGGSRAHQP